MLYQLLHLGLLGSQRQTLQVQESAGSIIKDPVRKEDDDIPHPVCPPLPGMEDVLVVMKTGVTEAYEKVPIHLNTTLRCIPNYVIFSDFEEDIDGVRIHDAFRHLDPEVKRQVPDFDLYNRLQQMGREGLKMQDFQDEANSAVGKPNNPGWKLDKWKFLPMVKETLQYKEDAKWYFFMEADTYPVWPNLLAWLSKFNPDQPHYIGTETQIGDVIFAHGGSGFVISNPALRRAVGAYVADPVGINTYTDFHWAGDCVLGKVLFDVGVPLRFSWPLLQNSNLGELDEFTQDFYRRPWCFPAVALHHLSPADIRSLWVFEQRRLNVSDKHNNMILHKDIFTGLIQPSLSSTPRENWDNFSPEPRAAAVASADDCHSFCLQHPECVQYSFKHGLKRCFTSKTPRLGVKSAGSERITSGWMLNRVQQMVREAGVCEKVDFGI